MRIDPPTQSEKVITSNLSRSELSVFKCCMRIDHPTQSEKVITSNLSRQTDRQTENFTTDTTKPRYELSVFKCCMRIDPPTQSDKAITSNVCIKRIPITATFRKQSSSNGRNG